jgi:hypothetical protein
VKQADFPLWLIKRWPAEDQLGEPKNSTNVVLGGSAEGGSPGSRRNEERQHRVGSDSGEVKDEKNLNYQIVKFIDSCY